MKLQILILLLAQFLFSQKNYQQELFDKKVKLQEGAKAYSEKNYELAKDIFKKGNNLYPSDPDFLYNLAAVEVSLNENESACEHFYQLFQNKSINTLKEIKNYCPNFRNGTIKSIHDVEVKPKFILGGKEYDLFVNQQLSQSYITSFSKKIQSLKFLKENFKGKILVIISTDDTGDFKFKFNTFAFDKDKDDKDAIETEIKLVIQKSFTYIPAKHNGRNVQLFESWNLPIVF